MAAKVGVIHELPLRYWIMFFMELSKERYEGQEDKYFYYRYQQGNPVLNINDTSNSNSFKRYLRR